MIGIQREIDWLKARLRPLPAEYRDTFLHDTGVDNLIRLQFLCAFLTLFSLLVFVNPEIFMSKSGADLSVPLQINILFGSSALALLVSAKLILSFRIEDINWALRLPVTLIALGLLWWGAYAGTLNPFGFNASLFFVICLFVVFSVFVLSLPEAVGVLLNGILAYSWFYLLLPDGRISIGLVLGLGFVFTIGFLVSRMGYYSQLSAFLNWENISSMNSTLKREIKSHQETLEELEAIRADLDNQVRQKTSYLQETNQKLQQEIAERGYADKVKSVLYRISGFVNQNKGLEETIGNIHHQLRQILDVTNFMVGIYNEEKLQIEPVYQENSIESFDVYRLGRTLSSYVIRNKKSLLVDKKGIKKLVAEGEIEIVGLPADSWLGVPLLAEKRVVGVLIVQSYKPGLIYDASDLQLLEFASEHVALAIDHYRIQNNLIMARDQAEESDRLKSAFLSNLSHEIRTPLNSIMGFAEMINEPDYTDAQLRNYTSQVVINGQQLLNTLTNMIDLAKLQVDQMPFRFEVLEAGGLLAGLKEEILHIAGQRNKFSLEVKQILEPAPDSIHFLADPDRFRQMFTCLAENAVKFTTEGHIEIGCRKNGNGEILFWVRDTGIGMDSGELEQVFQWFTKGQAGSERVYRGTGLGLTISRLIIERMNGRIWAESEPGLGSCFYFTLPAENGRSIPFIPQQIIEEDERAAGNSLHAV
jgi:signal transduction histidine kinase